MALRLILPRWHRWPPTPTHGRIVTTHITSRCGTTATAAAVSRDFISSSSVEIIRHHASSSSFSSASVAGKAGVPTHTTLPPTHGVRRGGNKASTSASGHMSTSFSSEFLPTSFNRAGKKVMLVKRAHSEVKVSMVPSNSSFGIQEPFAPAAAAAAAGAVTREEVSYLLPYWESLPYEVSLEPPLMYGSERIKGHKKAREAVNDPFQSSVNALMREKHFPVLQEKLNSFEGEPYTMDAVIKNAHPERLRELARVLFAEDTSSSIGINKGSSLLSDTKRTTLSADDEMAQALDRLDMFLQANWGVLLEDLSVDEFRTLQALNELGPQLTGAHSLNPQELEQLPLFVSPSSPDNLKLIKTMRLKSPEGNITRGSPPPRIPAQSEITQIGRTSVSSMEELKSVLETRTRLREDFNDEDTPVRFRTLGGALRHKLYGRSALPIRAPISTTKFSKDADEGNYISPRYRSLTEYHHKVDKDSLMSTSRRQFLIEYKTFLDSIKQYKEVQASIAALGLIADTGSAHDVWINWANQMVPKIKVAQECGEIPHFLSAEILSVIACKETLNVMLSPKRDRDKDESALDTWKKMELDGSSQQVSSNVALIGKSIGDKVNFEWNCKAMEDRIKKKDGSISDEIVKKYREARKTKDRRALLRLLSIYHNKSWDEFEVRVPLGMKLLEILIKTAKVEADFHEAKQELTREYQQQYEAKLRRSGEQVDPDKVPRPDFHLLKSDNNPSKVLVHVFYHRLIYKNKKHYGQIAMRHVAEKSLRGEWGSLAKCASPVLQPMIREPLPWRSGKKGCYLLNPVKLVRHKGVKVIDRDLECYDSSRVTKVLDILSATPWRINKRIVDFIEHARVNDLRIADIPAMENEIPPERPTEEDLFGLTKQEKFKLKMEIVNVLRNNEKLQSTRPTMALKMNVAHNYYNAERIYFPHNVDYRGRSYPLPPHLHHQGDDLCRGMLEFAEGKPLGKEGWRWLHISLANLFGKDKLSFDDRKKWTEDNSEMIKLSARSPFDERVINWWSTAGDGPWQFLARCIEYTDALESGDPETFISHQTVHMDGSCNGLQHYAALGHDEWGARSVNLLSSKEGVPQDVYMEVLGVVRKNVERDARIWRGGQKQEENGTTQVAEEEGQTQGKIPKTAAPESGVEADGSRRRKASKKTKGELAQEEKASKNTKGKLASEEKKSKKPKGELAQMAIDLGVLERKTVKQTVMTICYGVTTLGAKDQVRARLVDKVGNSIEPQDLNQLATYLSNTVLYSIGEVFKQAMQIKTWFDNASRSFNQAGVSVSWMTPLGFAVRQPYYEHKSKSIKTALQVVNLVKKNEDDKVKKASQRSGFPPNFVHSLDATHMMLVAEQCHKEGIRFAGVHDSFWTHASDVTRMNEIIRDKFIELHSEPILQDLEIDFRTRLGLHAASLPKLPPQGDLNLEAVRESPYFFD